MDSMACFTGCYPNPAATLAGYPRWIANKNRAAQADIAPYEDHTASSVSAIAYRNFYDVSIYRSTFGIAMPSLKPT
jgi:hypothetical protein